MRNSRVKLVRNEETVGSCWMVSGKRRVHVTCDTSSTVDGLEIGAGGEAACFVYLPDDMISQCHGVWWAKVGRCSLRCSSYL